MTEMQTMAVGVGIGLEPDCLMSIGGRGVSAAIWNRRLPDGLSAWLDRLDPDRVPGLRDRMPVAAVTDRVLSVLSESALDGDGMAATLAADCAMLAGLLGRALGTTAVMLRFDVVRDDSCRLFHLDNVPARLMCTYRGPGTEYGRARSGSEPDPVYRLDRGAVGLFRGATWPARERPGILHRSPRLGDASYRFLLVIDPVFAE